jgi:outer membrane receptor protein involved in Fe transport
LAITDARIDDHGLAIALDGERPAQVPAVQGTLRLQWAERERLAALTLRTIGKQDENEGDDEALPGTVTLDAVARWPIRNGLALDLRVENLFDRRVISSILADGTRERAMPRSLWIGLRFN